MNYLNIHQIVAIHEEIIQATGGSFGIRDTALLESAAARPQAGFGEEEFYPDIFAKAAALGHSIICNHPFVDGNKRAGYLAMRIFLKINKYDLKASVEKKYDFIMKIAQYTITEEDISKWLKKNSKKMTVK